MNQPLVSVIMSVYNAEAFLSEAIDSILGQTYPNFEFIIINDGSTDKSKDIINHYAHLDKRIKVIERPNKGLVASLNEALAIARGKYVARQDADDISLPERFDRQISFLEANTSIGLVGSNIAVIDDQGKPVPKHIVNIDFFTSPDDLKLAEVFFNQFGHGSVMGKADLLQNLAYDPAYIHAEDYDLWARLSHHAHLANLKEPLYKWRFHNEGITSSHSQAMQNQTENIVTREFQYYLSHKSEYKFFSFKPFSMRGGIRSYLAWKARLYKCMAFMYARHGLRRRAIPIFLLAFIHAPWLKNIYRCFFATLRGRQALDKIGYDIY